MALLEVKDLHVSFNTDDGVVQAVRGVSFEVDRGAVFGHEVILDDRGVVIVGQADFCRRNWIAVVGGAVVRLNDETFAAGSRLEFAAAQ